METAVSTQQKLGAQLSENTLVDKVGMIMLILQELSSLEADAAVFKLMGTALVKQDKDEARVNVAKRIEFIKSEM